MNSENSKFRALIAVTSIFLLIATIFPQFSVRAATKEELQQQLQQIEQQIAQYQQQLAQTQGEKNTLANKIKQLRGEQAQLNLQIQRTNLLIGQLDDQISTTQDSIKQNEQTEDKLKAQISSAVREMYQSDDKGMVFAFAGGEGLSGLFDQIDRTKQLSKSLSDSLDEMRQVKETLQQQNNQLEGQKGDAQNLLQIKSLQQQDLSSKLGEQNDLLSQTKGREAQYQASLSESQKRAAQIRNQIYGLAGGTTQRVTFGQALAYAQQASQLTGVRAAFLLAILTQETNLGANVGTCNRAGDPPSKSWRVVMKPSRDQGPFQTITADLALDIDTTPVSCPARDSRGNYYGWGGGMGPAQFIPSTWMGYKDKVTAITGDPANPWNIRDAFVAAAIKLKADGALDGGNGEWNAAMRYFSGSTNTRYRFYGDNVVRLAAQYQNDIDTLSQ